MTIPQTQVGLKLTTDLISSDPILPSTESQYDLGEQVDVSLTVFLYCSCYFLFKPFSLLPVARGMSTMSQPEFNQGSALTISAKS